MRRGKVEGRVGGGKKVNKVTSNKRTKHGGESKMKKGRKGEREIIVLVIQCRALWHGS